MKVTVIGTGFVGVVSAAVFASFGNEVVGLDIDPRKVEMLRQGKVPFYEPGLEDLLHQEQAKGNLSFTTDYSQAIPGSQVVLVAVGTPSAPDGTADLKFVRSAVESAAPFLSPKAIVCIKSTVPPGTLQILHPLIAQKTSVPFVLASAPEFLREGTAVQDTLHPDRVVIGCEDTSAQNILRELHEPFRAPIIFTKPESAQMGKYAANAYLATRISFINQIADLCELNGADVQEVIEIIGHDRRIGPHYWYPGLGYGGSCFPKDVRELAAYSRTVGHGNNLFNKVHELNESRIFEKLARVEEVIGSWSGKRVAVLGLSFKPNTDDLRDAPSTKVLPHLLSRGAEIHGYDPMANEVARQWFGSMQGVSIHDSLEEAIESADVVLALIEWSQITGFDFATWKQKHAASRGLVFFDARNQFNPTQLREAGWQVVSIGRPDDAMEQS